MGQNSLLTVLMCLKKTSILSSMIVNVIEWIQISRYIKFVSLKNMIEYKLKYNFRIGS